jgi:hypothetical protein
MVVIGIGRVTPVAMSGQTRVDVVRWWILGVFVAMLLLSCAMTLLGGAGHSRFIYSLGRLVCLGVNVGLFLLLLSARRPVFAILTVGVLAAAAAVFWCAVHPGIDRFDFSL